MDHLTSRERELVALGAALASNCVPCIEHHVPEARKAGLADAQIAEAIRLADSVRQVPARKVLDTASRLLGGAAAGAGPGDKPCGAGAGAAPSATPCCG